MNITFLIGNGFDLKLGLNTRYSDFYSYYHEKASKESIILKWMKEDDDKGNWADLEMALGNKINDIDEVLEAISSNLNDNNPTFKALNDKYKNHSKNNF